MKTFYCGGAILILAGYISVHPTILSTAGRVRGYTAGYASIRQRTMIVDESCEPTRVPYSEAAFLSDLDAACYVVKHMAFNARGIAYGSEERGPLIFRSQAKQRFSVPGELIVPLAIRQFGVSNGSWKTTCARRKRKRESGRTPAHNREFHTDCKGEVCGICIVK